CFCRDHTPCETTAIESREAIMRVGKADSHGMDPLAGAIERSAGHRRQLAEMAGEMLGSVQVSDLLGISRQEIDKRRNAHRLLGIQQGSDWLYPAFQFGSDDVLPGIETVL